MARRELSEESLSLAQRELGPVYGPAFASAAAKLRAEQPHLLRSVVTDLAPLGARPLHLALQLLVLEWQAQRVQAARPARQVSRRNYLGRVKEIGEWMDRMALVDLRMLDRWVEHGRDLPQPNLLVRLVSTLFDDPRVAGLTDGERALIFQTLHASLEALGAAGSRRGERLGEREA